MKCSVCKKEAEFNEICPICGFENRLFATKEDANNWLQSVAKPHKMYYELQQSHNELRKGYGELQKSHGELQQNHNELHRNHGELQQSHIQLHAEHQETKNQIAAIIKRLDEKPKVEENLRAESPKPQVVQVGNIMPFGGYDWRVLAVENNRALLISEKVLEQRPYHDVRQAITWEQCSLRKYLNNEFYNSLGAENPKIAQAKNPNANNPQYGTAGGNPTSDKIFLLSIEEVNNYFVNNDDRIAKNTAEKACWWWLRSPGCYSFGAAFVYGDGSVLVFGSNVFDASGGVRPALWLNL
ncbi:MAG: DUF6273 domain-containing protein [Defluviitaleaceae bacterium]|nr:DUF6273 domain-containing protein [Defluviitaleaceae bacterium]